LKSIFTFLAFKEKVHKVFAIFMINLFAYFYLLNMQSFSSLLKN